MLAFLAVSGVLARFLSVENVERDADLALIQAAGEGRRGGHARAAERLPRAPCVRGDGDRANAHNPRLLRPGAVKILQLDIRRPPTR